MERPKLIPVRVPWTISSVPHFRVRQGGNGVITVLDFIAFFHLEAQKHPSKSTEGIQIVEEAPEFTSSDTAKGAPYRMVRISFEEPVYSNAVDSEPFPYALFDLSNLPVDSKKPKSISERRALWREYFMETGLSPNPCMYEIDQSSLLAKLGDKFLRFKHMVLVGEDVFFDVVARSWIWTPGQAVD